MSKAIRATKGKRSPEAMTLEWLLKQMDALADDPTPYKVKSLQYQAEGFLQAVREEAAKAAPSGREAGVSERVAQRNWHTRARVRILADHASQSVDPSGVRHFRADEETVLIQWGWAGREIDRGDWWDSADIDGAHIIPASKVEVITVLDEVLPF